MDIENESTGDSEDETDNCTLQYQAVDSSLLGTAVFIKDVQIESNDLVLLYVHNPQQLEAARTSGNPMKDLFKALGLFFAVLTVIAISIY